MSNHISVLIHDFLLEKKEISLEKIGSLHLKQSTVTTENGQSFPEVAFTYDKTVTTTEEFIDFAAEKEHKNKAIVKSDIDYFLEENRQLMNIGTGVLVIAELGYIHSLKTGGYSFSQQPISGFRDNEIRKKVLSGDIYDRTAEPSNMESQPIKFRNASAERSNNSLKILGLIIILLVLGSAGFGIYYLFNHSKIKPNKDDVLATAADTASVAEKVAGDNKENSDSVSKNTETANNQQDIYKFVFEVTKDSERARTRIAKLKAYGDKVAYDSVNTTEGLYFRLYSPIPKTADTTKAKDSLFKYFQKPIQIAKHN